MAKTGIDLSEFFTSEGKAVILKARVNLSNNKRGRFRRVNTSRMRLSNSLKAKKTKNSLSFHFEKYGLTVDAGARGTNGQIQSAAPSLFPQGAIRKAPPTSRILQWMKEKPVNPQEKKYAYNIAQKIKREGLEPKLFFTDAWNDREPQFKKHLQETVQKAIDESIPPQQTT